MAYPNQKTIIIKKTKVTNNFLQISNENWMNACKDLGAISFPLYLYLASNADGYEIELSLIAVENSIGMKKTTYYDSIKKLIDKGYLIPINNSKYEFYEIPFRHTENLSATRNEDSAKRNNFPPDGKNFPPDGREIYNIDNIYNNTNKTDTVENTPKAYSQRGNTSKEKKVIKMDLAAVLKELNG